MGYAVQRRFPRIPTDQAAEIEYLDRGCNQRVKKAVSVRSIACEGIGCEAASQLALARKMRINVVFSVEGTTLSLPGAVAWVRGAGLGIHLLLELAPPEIRQRWAHWIVGKTSDHRRHKGRPVR